MKSKDGTEPDGSLEGLDDIDGPVDDAWTEAVQKLIARQSARAAKERSRVKAMPRRPPPPPTLKEQIAGPFLAHNRADHASHSGHSSQSHHRRPRWRDHNHSNPDSNRNPDGTHHA